MRVMKKQQSLEIYFEDTQFHTIFGCANFFRKLLYIIRSYNNSSSTKYLKFIQEDSFTDRDFFCVDTDVVRGENGNEILFQHWSLLLSVFKDTLHEIIGSSMYSVYIGKEDTIGLSFVLAMFCDLQIWSHSKFYIGSSPLYLDLKRAFLCKNAHQKLRMKSVFLSLSKKLSWAQ